MLTLLLLLLSASNVRPTAAPACCDTLVLDSLGRELGDGSTLTTAKARAIRHAALQIADSSNCGIARNRAEEMAFDMETIVISLDNRR